MKDYDVIVVGSGCGGLIVEEAVAHRLEVALVDKGPAGGTCLNVGCIPSKMLIYVADRIVETQEAGRLGIQAEVTGADFGAVMKRVTGSVSPVRQDIRRSLKASKEMDFYETEGHFVDDYTLAVDGERIRGKKIFLASGSRPMIPPIPGLSKAKYLTNETLLKLKERPESLIIIGGGYIAVEYGHFFAAMGTRVTILEMAERLVLQEEPEISEVLKQQMSKRMEVHTGTQALEVRMDGDSATVVARDRASGRQEEFTAQKILVAVGRISNADLLKLENTGVELDARGYVKVNDYLETTVKDVFAVGDANGQQMFTHVANREAALAAHKVLHGTDTKMDYGAAPHAVYSHPQIASVGLSEENARKEHQILVGKTDYSDIAKGEAMMETGTFAKAIVEKGSGRILGCHIIGPYAPELIQEVVNAMTSGGHINDINRAMHIHPALTELISRTFSGLEGE